LKIFFKTVSVVRLLGIILIFILDKLWSASISDSKFDWFEGGFDIRFEWWQVAVMYLMLISYPVNTLVSLAISFKYRIIFSRYFRDKIILIMFYVAEAILIPFYIYFGVMRVNETFSEKSPGILDRILGPLFPKNERAEIIEKLQVLNFVLLAVCSLVFIVFFWKFYNKRKEETDQEELHTV
jgi:hypothetical protein